MKSRYLLYSAFSTVFLVFGWGFFVYGPLVPVSELTLNVMGGFLDAVRPLRGSFPSDDGLRLQPMPYPSVSNASKSPVRPPWKPYLNQSADPFTHKYVISLPHRMDRREDMEHLRAVLAVNWTYVDAIGAGDASVSRLVGCARERARISSNKAVFTWPTTFEHDGILDAEDTQLSSLCPAHSATGTEPASTLQSEEIPPLTCARRDFLRGPPFDVSLPPYMLLSPAKFACWSSHIQVLERFVFNRESAPLYDAHEVALVLEDDVDMEQFEIVVYK